MLNYAKIYPKYEKELRDKTFLKAMTKDGKYTLEKITDDTVVSATFKKAFYKMNIDITGEGTVSPCDGEVVTHGETITLKILPDGGYDLYEVKVNGKKLYELLTAEIYDKL